MEEINKITVNGVEHEVADASSRITLSALVQSFAELSGSKQDALTQGKGIIISESNEISVDDKTVVTSDEEGYIHSWYKFDRITAKNLLTEDASIKATSVSSSHIDANYAQFTYSNISESDIFNLHSHHADIDVSDVSLLYAYEAYLGNHSVRITGNSFTYNSYNVLTENSKRILPEHYLTAYDGLLYMDRGCESIVPVSHPDYSTQPSILPQRFGNMDVYEVMIPLEQRVVNEMPYLLDDSIGDCLHYLNNFLNTTNGHLPYRFTMTTKQSKDFYLHSNDLEIYTESFGDCLIIIFQDRIYLIDPNCDKIYDFIENKSSKDNSEMLDKLLEDIDFHKNLDMFWIIPAKIHSLDTSHEYHPYWDFITASGDVFIHRPYTNSSEISSIKQLFYHLSKEIEKKMPDYNVNNIPDFNHLEILDKIADGTIIDAKLFNGNGAISPCQVFSHKNNQNYSAGICIKEVMPSSYDYSWCMIQYATTCFGYDGGGE